MKNIMRGIQASVVLIGSLLAGVANAGLCNSLLDMDAEAGCSFTSLSGYEGGTGQVVVYTIPNSSGNTRFEKIVYIAEPFAVLEDHSKTDVMNILGSSTSGSMVNQLTSDGFDIIIFSYPGNLNDTYLQRKSYAMASALEQIKTWRSYDDLDNDFYKETLIGLSLGGVISRYALAFMEQQGVEHGIDTYISVDSPHKGANVPLSLQRTLSFISRGFEKVADANQTWYNKFTAWSLSRIGYDEISHGLNNLSGYKRDALGYLANVDTVAVQQLLINHYSTSIEHPLKTQLQSELNQLGFPKKSNNIAIVNAGLSGQRVSHYYNKYLQADTPTASSTNWELNASSTNSIEINFNGEFRYPKKYLTYTEIKYYRKNWNMTGYSDVDSGVCSSVGLPGQVIRMLNDNFFTQYKDYQVNVLDSMTCFIPAASALAINTNDYNITPLVSSTSFDRVLGGAVLEEHLSLDFHVNDIVSEANRIPAWFVPVITAGLLL
jgi:hypothetical protein